MVNKERKKIVLVDDQIVNLSAGRAALADTYDVYTVPSGEKLLKLIPKVVPDMILLDIEMPEMNGYDVLKILKDDPATDSIPVMFLTSRDDAGSELEGLSLGAVDYVSKPFSPPLLLKRIEVHLLVEDQKQELRNYNDNLEEMVRQKTKTILELQNSILETVAELVECRDDTTGGHIARTSKYLKIMIGAMLERNIYSNETYSWNTELMVSSAQLHDVGKISISDAILRKPGKLIEDEFEEMKKHTVFGEQVIEKMQSRNPNQEFLDYAKILTLYHHERWDGLGYPRGLAAENIPLPARLMSIVDVYDALISERPYKKAFPHEEAVRIIMEGKGSQFDPVLTDLFLSVSDEFAQAGQI